jgi:anti-sigma B factor antagonist
VSEQPDQFTQVNGVPVVRAAVEVDATNASDLREAIVAALGPGTARLIVDLGGTEFCDSTGLNVLLLVATEPTLLRIFKVTGMDSMFRLFASLDEALVAAGKTTQ